MMWLYKLKQRVVNWLIWIYFCYFYCYTIQYNSMHNQDFYSKCYPSWNSGTCTTPLGGGSGPGRQFAWSTPRLLLSFGRVLRTFFLQILSEIGFNPGLVCPKSGFYWSPSHRCFVPARLFHLFWLLLGRYMAPLRFSGLSHYPVYYFYFFIICHNKIPFVGIELESRNRLQKFFNAGG